MGLLTVLPGAGAGLPVDPWLLASVGLVGSSLLDRFTGDGDGDDAADDDPLMADDGAFGGADDDDDLGELGGMDDWNDEDPFGEEDGDDGLGELQNRVGELESEVATLSSTVNTVRSENEEIAGRVEDMGEDVRSLLDIYEMVTRGINPFVDDVQTGGSGGGRSAEGSFGLFDDASDEEEDDDELDEDLATADAEGFFDEELVDDGDADDEPDFDDLDDLGDDTDTQTMASDNGGSGKSFSELKDEYDSGDADWADEEAADDLGLDAPSGGDRDADPLGDAPAEDTGDEPDEGGEPARTDDDAPASTAGPTDPTADDEGGGGFEFVEEGQLTSQPRKPYLRELPGDYVGDLMVMEWLEFLVESSDTTDAVRAVNYYARVDWIDDEVAAQLKAFLSGFGDIDRNLMDRPGTAELGLEHHTRSLKYIMQLTNATAESVVIDRWPQLSGGLHGVQR